MPFKTYLKFFEIISQSHDRGFAHFTVKPRLLLLAANQLKGLFHTKSHAWMHLAQPLGKITVNVLENFNDLFAP